MKYLIIIIIFLTASLVSMINHQKVIRKQERTSINKQWVQELNTRNINWMKKNKRSTTGKYATRRALITHIVYYNDLKVLSIGEVALLCGCQPTTVRSILEKGI